MTYPESYPELELYFSRRGEAEFAVALRLREPGNVADRRFEADPVRIAVPRFATRELLGDPSRYGWELGTALFAHPVVREAFAAAVELAGRMKTSLRLRLCTDQRSRDDLYRLRWELLRKPHPEAPDDPARADWLMDKQSLWFSRHLFSGDMRPVRLKRRSELSALVAVASPTDLVEGEGDDEALAPIDILGELETARRGLDPIKPTEIVPGERRVTFARLLEAFGAEPDVFYLVCHGTILDGEPRLMLENDDGTADMVSGARLIDAMVGLRSLPRLVVLISCESGGGDHPRADVKTPVLSAIGPRLAEAGVPAVLAMQGNLLMGTARRFLPPFFAELRQSGQVDAAVTMGRAAVRDAADAWVPVLTTRLVEGRVWSTGGLNIDGDDAFRAWKQLVNQIGVGKCVPILGSGVLDPFLGASREVANRLAEANGYPMALSGREDVPQVAQFLKAMLDDSTTRIEWMKESSEAIRRRWSKLGLPPADPLNLASDLLAQLTKTWRAYQQDHPFEPHRYLAGMRSIRTIITTNPDTLLAEAMRDAGRTPRVIPCRWDGSEGDEPAGGAAPDRSLVPTEDAPHVYQLFGHLDNPDSVVLTEDDYFQFLTSVARRQSQKKDIVQRDDDLSDVLLYGTLASSVLVFLGFRLTDWDFRSLFRVLIDQGGKSRRSRFTHIAVQIDPEDGTHSEAVRARNYIERLFRELVTDRQSGKIAVYWGGVEDFIQDLDTQWQAMQQPALAPTIRP